MTWPPLVEPPAGVDSVAWAAACRRIRDECGWHIAPTLTEDVRVRLTGPALVLPSMEVIEVASVAIAGQALSEDDWELMPDEPVVMLSGRWWCRHRVATVTMSHGYEECPEDLLPVLRAMASVPANLVGSQVQAGPFQVSAPAYASAGASSLSDTQRTALTPYKRPPRP